MIRSKNHLTALCLFGAVAGAVVIADATRPQAAGTTRQATPFQAIVETFGTKQMVGFFLARDGRCEVTMLVDEAPVRREEAGLPFTSPVRVRLSLEASGTARFDTAEGDAALLRCGDEQLEVTVEPAFRQLAAR